jgi:Tannase-like family of unknown function (DUF6351)
MRRTRSLAALAACAAFLAACGGGDERSGAPTVTALRVVPADPAMTVQLRVLSSAAQWVSGGDARIEVRAAPGLHDKLELWLNGQRLEAGLQSRGDRLEGVIAGLADGDNTLEVLHRASGARDTIRIVNHPITGPMFSGPQQTPFVCTTIQGAVGRQPLVDSAASPGTKVTDAQGA